MPSGFIIDGETLEIPELNTLNMDEAMILYEYSGLTLEDFAPDQDDGTYSEEQDELMAQRAKNPGFIMALMHTALGRAHPDWKKSRIRNLIGQCNLLEALEQFVGATEDEEEDDARPPELPPQKPQQSSERSSDDSSVSSGNGSHESSDEPADIPEPIGTGASVTSLTSHPTTSE